VKELRKISIVAHRGGAALMPENTLAAFRYAIELGVDAVECDVHLTADGQVVVFHDFSLQQLTGVAGTIEEIDEQHRQKLRIGAGNELPPLLRELVQLLVGKTTRLYLEIKTNGRAEHELQLAEKSCDILRELDLLKQTSAISFEPTCLAPLMAAGVSCGPCVDNPDIFLGQSLTAQLAYWQSEGYRDLSLNGGCTSPDFVKAAIDFGFYVGVWTINGPARLNYWLAQPVHYITTDQPNLALHLRGSLH